MWLEKFIDDIKVERWKLKGESWKVKIDLVYRLRFTSFSNTDDTDQHGFFWPKTQKPSPQYVLDFQSLQDAWHLFFLIS